MTDSAQSILVVDDDVAVGQVVTALLSQAGFSAACVDRGEAALLELNRKPYDLVLTDVRMPGMGGLGLLKAVTEKHESIPVVLISAHGTFELAVEALRLGAADFIKKPFDREEIVFVIKKALAGNQREQSAPPRAVVRTSAALDAILGKSEGIEAVRSVIRKVAPTSATVLIRGESGTGKELVASAIHQLSPRAKGPFVRLNCGALPDNLLESELFGHEKGAFTGAVQRKPGRVELADKGTLFLDEIGDVTPALQVKLLRLLQERQFERLGGTETLSCDIRFIAATHKPLEELVKKGEFREDLFYRLNVVPLTVPPLRSRAEDVELLVAHFVKTHRRAVTFDAPAMALLSRYPWPGNIRQLQNLIERLVVLADSPTLGAQDVERELSKEAQFASVSHPEETLEGHRRDSEREAVKQALSKANGNRSQAARLLGVSRRTLYNKLESLGFSDDEPVR